MLYWAVWNIVVHTVYSYNDATLNSCNWINIIATIETATSNAEYMNPPEKEPVVSFPKNNPAIHDCTKIATPNNSNLLSAANSNVALMVSFSSSWAPKLV